MPSSSLPLVLLPGLDGTGEFFEAFCAALPSSLGPRVVRYPRDLPLGYDALLERVLPELPQDRPWVLLGESFAGPLALKLAAKAPRGLIGLVLVATFHRRPVPSYLSAFSWAVGPTLFRRPLPRFVIHKALAGTDAPEQLVADFQVAVTTVAPEVLATRAQAALKADATEEARSCPVPALYLAAAGEGLMRRELPDELAQLIPDFRVERLDTPHLVLQRAPEQSARLIEQFVAGCAERPKGAETAR